MALVPAVVSRFVRAVRISPGRTCNDKGGRLMLVAKRRMPDAWKTVESIYEILVSLSYGKILYINMLIIWVGMNENAVGIKTGRHFSLRFRHVEWKSRRWLLFVVRPVVFTLVVILTQFAFG